MLTLMDKLKNTQDEKDYLLTMLDDDTEMTICDVETRTYTPQLRECVMKLTSLNVHTRNVAPVIENSRIPSRQGIDNIVCEKVVIGKFYNTFLSTTLDTFKEILTDISVACEEMLSNNKPSCEHNILSNIVSCLTEQRLISHFQNF
ncbi:hypothetical protein KUTeg_018181 [Tegillarca granosa]|uniref:Uncharacterized protein n=1 Tax=Tegillarca granosa TaxID=220873 RepID=A0ABQ9EH46_TEGGR|nr:hypothetical protein KUTeg_018181 [Tegillarca granosa]